MPAGLRMFAFEPLHIFIGYQRLGNYSDARVINLYMHITEILAFLQTDGSATYKRTPTRTVDLDIFACVQVCI